MDKDGSKPTELDTTIVKQITLILAIVICLAIAIFIILWAQEPEQRPLISNIELVDAVKVVDILENEDIHYQTNLQAKMIFINSQDMDKARLALARVGIVINYPEIQQDITPESACALLADKMDEAKINARQLPVYQQPWFEKITRLLVGMVTIIVLIVAVVRPMLRELIYPNGMDKEDDI